MLGECLQFVGLLLMALLHQSTGAIAGKAAGKSGSLVMNESELSKAFFPWVFQIPLILTNIHPNFAPASYHSMRQ